MKTLLFFLAMTGLVAIVGLTIVTVVRPGDGIDPTIKDALMQEFAGQADEQRAAATACKFGVNTFVAIVPRNPVQAADSDMLGLIFFSVMTVINGRRCGRCAPAARSSSW